MFHLILTFELNFMLYFLLNFIYITLSKKLNIDFE